MTAARASFAGALVVSTLAVLVMLFGGCGIEPHSIGSDSLVADDEVGIVCVPNDAGADGGFFIFKIAKLEECGRRALTNIQAVLSDPECPFQPCYMFINELMAQREAEAEAARHDAGRP
jgi:hypothetical protein